MSSASSLALNPAAISRPMAISPWVVAVVVLVPTFMEILDTTVANVALRYIAGGLNAAQSDADWVITSYLAANAIVLPITGWLSTHLGRRNYFLLSIAVFTLASAACGMATSLEQMIFFRVLQGLAGGGLQPCSQGVLMDAFPPEKQGTAMTLFGVAAIIAPIIGPTLGGWLCVDYNWRWIFLINVPMGVAAVIAAFFVVDDPAYLKQERSALRGKPLNFDYIGLSLLVLVMCAWEIMLSKGQEWDWLGDPVGPGADAPDTVRRRAGLVDHSRNADGQSDHQLSRSRRTKLRGLLCDHVFRLRRDLRRQHRTAGSGPVADGLRRATLRIDHVALGRVVADSHGAGRRAVGAGTDARLLIACGVAVMAAANYWMVRMNLEVGPWQLVGPRMLLTLGMGLMFAPTSVAAYKYVPPHLRAAAVGLLSLLRTEGGSVGTSMASTIRERRLQLHLSRIGDGLTPLNHHVQSFMQSAQQTFQQATGDPARSRLMGLNSLDQLRQQQALSLSYFDVFWIGVVVSAALVVLVLLLKRSVTEQGEHISAE